MTTAKRAAARIGDRRKRAFPAAITHGLFLSLIMGVAFLPLFSFLLLRTDDPSAYVAYAAPVASLLLSLFGGIRAGRLHRSNGALAGIAVGTLLAFFFLLAALIVGEGKLPITSLLLYLGMAVASTIGGAFSTGRKRRRRTH